MIGQLAGYTHSDIFYIKGYTLKVVIMRYTESPCKGFIIP